MRVASGSTTELASADVPPGAARRGIPAAGSIGVPQAVGRGHPAILETRSELDGGEREAALEKLLEELHIGHIRESVGVALSGGERRRVADRARLAAEPRFILLDEPFAGVDPISVLDIQRIIRHLVSRNIGVLITDHNVRETLGICGRAYIVSTGSVMAGSAEEILANREVREVYLGQDFRL